MLSLCREMGIRHCGRDRRQCLHRSGVWVFTRTAGVVDPGGCQPVGSGGAVFPKQGHSVALSADGNTAMVGGTTTIPPPERQGYLPTSGVWTQQGSKLVGTGAVGAAQQGYAVDLSGDGNTAIVGGNGDNVPSPERRGCGPAAAACGPSKAPNWSARARLEQQCKAFLSPWLGTDTRRWSVG